MQINEIRWRKRLGVAWRKAQILWKFSVNKDLISQVKVGLSELPRLENRLGWNDEVSYHIFIIKRKDFFMQSYLVAMLMRDLSRSIMGQDFNRIVWSTSLN